MKRTLYIIALLLTAIVINSQTQQGVVKTRGRMVNGKHVAGRGLSGATINILGRSAVLSQANGAFSFPVPNKSFMLQSVQKNGYQLVDADATMKSYLYSSNTFYVVMETPEQQSEDKLAAERNIRRTLQRQLQQRENEIEELKAKNKLTQEEYHKALQQLYDDQHNNEKVIANMAKEYAEIDYDQMDEKNRQISDAILNGRLIEADSLLRSKGEMSNRLVELNDQQEALTKAHAELKKIESIVTNKIKDLANDCYSRYQMFKLQCQNDSSAKYLELRAKLDTLNVDWQLDAGDFVYTYLADMSHALSYYERAFQVASSQRAGDNTLMNRTLVCLGNYYLHMNDLTTSLEYFQKALSIVQKKHKEPHEDLASAYIHIGECYYHMGEESKAWNWLTKGLEIFNEANSTNTELLLDITNDLANICSTMGSYIMALDYYKQCLALLDYDEETCDDISTATILNNMASNYECLGDYDRALQFAQKAFEARLHILGGLHPDVASSYSQIADIYFDLDKDSLALQNYKKSTDIILSIYGEKSPQVAIEYHQLGNVYRSMGSFQEAQDYYNKALTIYEFINKGFNQNVVSLYRSIASLYEKQNKNGEALKNYEKALKICEETKDDHRIDIATCHLFIGRFYENSEEYNLALQNYNEALNIYKEYEKDTYGGESSGKRIGICLMDIADVYLSQDKRNKALDAYRQAAKILTKRCGDKYPQLGPLYYHWGMVYSSGNDERHALECYKKALPLLRTTYGTHHYLVKNCYEYIGDSYNSLGKLEKAVENYEKVLMLVEESTITDSIEIAKCSLKVGNYYMLKLFQYEDACRYLIKACQFYDSPRNPSEDIADAYEDLANAYAFLHENEKATEYYQKAITYYRKVDYSESIERIQRNLEYLGTEEISFSAVRYYYRQGRKYEEKEEYKKAIEYYSKRLSILQKIVHDRYSDLADAYNDLADAYYSDDQLGEALKNYIEALNVCNREPKKYRIEIAREYKNIGYVYYRQKEYRQALECFQKSLELRSIVYGNRHVNTALICIDVADTYRKLEEHIKAVEYYEKALDMYKSLEKLDKDDSTTIYESSMNLIKEYQNAGQLLFLQKKYEQSALCFLRSLDIIKIQGDKWDMWFCNRGLGDAYRYMHDYDKAVECYKNALKYLQWVDDVNDNDYYADMLKQGILICQYEDLLVKNIHSESRLKEYVFIAVFAEENSPANKQGLIGEYVLLELANWNMNSSSSLFRISDETKGSPVDMVVMKNGNITRHHFEDKIGVVFKIKLASRDEWEQINKAYGNWKNSK